VPIRCGFLKKNSATQSTRTKLVEEIRTKLVEETRTKLVEEIYQFCSTKLTSLEILVVERGYRTHRTQLGCRLNGVGSFKSVAF